MTEPIATKEPFVTGRIVDGRYFKFWCRYCRTSHWHGIGHDPQNPLLGGRGAHCTNPRSPFYRRGYRLKLLPSRRSKPGASA